MGFQSYQKWKDKPLDSDKVTILYPGGFKPMTGGHLDLIKRYVQNPKVKEVKVLIGPGIRNGVDQEKALKIASLLTKDIPNVTVESVSWPSPVLTSFKIVGDAKPGNYALAASKKGEDYKRVKEFFQKHQPGSKFCREKEGIYVIELPINADPKKFIGRDDEYEETPISASVLRNDIVNDDLENFSTGYTDSSPEEISFVWDELAETVMNESMFTSGPPTNSSSDNYDRSYPSGHYKSTFPILEDGEEAEDISEGGGAGHLMSPWESMELTFGEIRELINKSLSGELENVTEKLDGQNLMVTVKKGNVYLARTQKQMKNGGELAIKWDEVKDSMGEKTPDFVKKAFQEAANDLQGVFGQDFSWDGIFKNGHRWLNIELLNPETENIVPYGEFQLRIHNMREVDENGKEINVIWNGGDLDTVIKFLKDSQDTGYSKKTHLIQKTNTVEFKNIKDLENIREGLIRKLQTLMDSNHLGDDNNIGDYLAEEIRLWLYDYFKSNGLGQNENTPLIEDLVQRWAYGNKTKNISAILKDQNSNISKFVKSWDSKIDDKIGNLLDPIIEIFSRVGIAVLQNISGIAASNPSKVSEGIRKKSEDAIKKIKEFINSSDVSNIKDFDKKVNYLETQLRRLEQAGGLEGVAPTEGIVFEYKGNLFKLTGNYLPILKIINFFQFGKDK